MFISCFSLSPSSLKCNLYYSLTCFLSTLATDGFPQVGSACLTVSPLLGPKEKGPGSPSPTTCIIPNWDLISHRKSSGTSSRGSATLSIWQRLKWPGPACQTWIEPAKGAGFNTSVNFDKCEKFLSSSSHYIFKFAFHRANQLLKVSQNLLKTYGDYWHLCV